jgi:hypothetical protein
MSCSILLFLKKFYSCCGLLTFQILEINNRCNVLGSVGNFCASIRFVDNVSRTKFWRRYVSRLDAFSWHQSRKNVRSLPSFMNVIKKNKDHDWQNASRGGSFLFNASLWFVRNCTPYFDLLQFVFSKNKILLDMFLNNLFIRGIKTFCPTGYKL